jgi:hypothetical protein
MIQCAIQDDIPLGPLSRINNPKPQFHVVPIKPEDTLTALVGEQVFARWRLVLFRLRRQWPILIVIMAARTHAETSLTRPLNHPTALFGHSIDLVDPLVISGLSRRVSVQYPVLAVDVLLLLRMSSAKHLRPFNKTMTV